MRCPDCGGKSRVANTVNLDVAVQRFRECRECGMRWDTWEEASGRRIRHGAHTQLELIGGKPAAAPETAEGSK